MRSHIEISISHDVARSVIPCEVPLDRSAQGAHKGDRGKRAIHVYTMFSLVNKGRSILLVLPLLSEAAFALPLVTQVCLHNHSMRMRSDAYFSLCDGQTSYDEHPSMTTSFISSAHAASALLPSGEDGRLISWHADIGWILQVLGLIAAASLIMVVLNLCMKLYTSRRTSGRVRLEGDELLVVAAQEITPPADSEVVSAPTRQGSTSTLRLTPFFV